MTKSQPLPCFYQVFINGVNSLVICDDECSFQTVRNLESQGFELVWDSAPSEFKGAKYAAEFYGAFLPVARYIL